MKTIQIIRNARLTGETIAAVDHLLALGYTEARAARACREYVCRLPLAVADLATQISTLEADLAHADRESVGVERGSARETRPIAWVLAHAEAIEAIADAVYDEAPEGDIDGYVAGMLAISERAHDLARRVRAALIASDEERDYEIRDDQTTESISSRPSQLDAAVREWVEGGDWGDDGANVRVRLVCVLTGAEDSHDVTIEAVAPPCARGKEHDWRSPYSVLGGLRENPGVVGNGGGVVAREVCAHCGRYRVTDTWAEDGRGGHCESVSYEDADDVSREWADRIQGRAADRRIAFSDKETGDAE